MIAIYRFQAIEQWTHLTARTRALEKLVRWFLVASVAMRILVARAVFCSGIWCPAKCFFHTQVICFQEIFVLWNRHHNMQSGKVFLGNAILGWRSDRENIFCGGNKWSGSPKNPGWPPKVTPIPFWIFLAQLIALRHILFGRSQLFVKHAAFFVIHCRSNQSLRKAPGRLPQHS